jgi:hypothetical protein
MRSLSPYRNSGGWRGRAFPGWSGGRGKAGRVEAHGHTAISRTAERVDFTRAGKKGGEESFNVKLIGGVPITFNFSTNAGLPEKKGINPVQLRCWLEHGSTDKPAMRKLAESLKVQFGMTRNGESASHKPKTATPSDSSNEPGKDPPGEDLPGEDADGEEALVFTDGGYTIKPDGSTWHDVRKWDKEDGEYEIRRVE